MGCVTVGTAGYPLRRAEAEILAVVTFEIGFDRNSGDLVPGHHLFIGMTFQAGLSMKFLVGAVFGIAQRLDVVQAVTVVAGS